MDKLFELYKLPLQGVLEASEAIMEIYHGDFEKSIKEDGSPVTLADLTSSKILNQYLEQTGIPVIGEELEKESYSVRKNWERVWCVDPLDGTKEFIKKNDEFVINIGLIENHRPLAGLIASPIRREAIIGGKQFGAYQFNYEDAFHPEKWRKLTSLNGISEPIRMISSRSHYSGNLLTLAQMLEKRFGSVDSKAMGSALKFFELVNDRADVYPRFAPTMEWDIIAGQAIYEAVGGKIVNIVTGEPLVYNKENLRNPYFIGFNSSLSLSLEFYQQN